MVLTGGTRALSARSLARTRLTVRLEAWAKDSKACWKLRAALSLGKRIVIQLVYEPTKQDLTFAEV